MKQNNSRGLLNHTLKIFENKGDVHFQSHISIRFIRDNRQLFMCRSYCAFLEFRSKYEKVSCGFSIVQLHACKHLKPSQCDKNFFFVDIYYSFGDIPFKDTCSMSHLVCTEDCNCQKNGFI